jgi:CheY-like chemotaxis protein
MTDRHPQSDPDANSTTGPPKALRVFVVEDEGMVAMLIEDMLTELGHEVGAVASRMEEALQIAKTGLFDFAIVDVNLDGQPSYPLAGLLNSRGIPFAFATGYGLDGLDHQFAAVPTLAKPFVTADLARLLSNVQRRS